MHGHMAAASGIGGGAAGPWYRVQAIMADGRRGGTAEQDYASVLPAVLNAAQHRRPFVAGWLSRGSGAPLELITNAGPLPEPGVADRARMGPVHVARPQPDRPPERPDLDAPVIIEPSRVIGPNRAVEPAGAIDPAAAFEPKELLFPWGARGVPMPGGLLADLDRLIWAPCPGRHAPALGWDLAQSAGDLAGGYLGRGAPYGPAGRRNGDDQADRHPTLFESALVTLM